MELYSGHINKLIEELAALPQYGKFDILAHYDIIVKNVELLPFVDVTDKRYLDAARETIYALKPHIELFEVNTGAMARGYRTAPYPQPELVREFKNAGFGAVISSDCHDNNLLDCYFDESIELMKSVGFNEIESKSERLTQLCFETVMSVPGILVYAKNLGIVTFNMTKMRSEVLSGRLNDFGICVRGGLHCAPYAHEKLGTMGFGAVRTSVSHFTNEKEIYQLGRALKKIAKEK